MNLDLNEAQRVLACLGDPSRFRIVAVLAAGDRCVTEIATEVGLSQSCTTRHLQELLRRDVVSRVRQGKRVRFRLRDEDPAMAHLLEWALLRAPAPGTAGYDGAAGERVSGASRHQDEIRSRSYRAARSTGQDSRTRIETERQEPLAGDAPAPPTPEIEGVPRAIADAGALAPIVSERGHAAPPVVEAEELEDYLL